MDLNNSMTPEIERNQAQAPQWFVEAVENFLGFKFELDVCCLIETKKCAIYYSLEDHNVDGLTLPWTKYNWCNPPYGNIQPWVNKAQIEAQLGKTSCLLIPDKPEVGYVRNCRDLADTIMHMPFRLNFLHPNGSEFLDKNGKKQGPKFPVMVALFTPYGERMPTRDIYVDFKGLTKKVLTSRII